MSYTKVVITDLPYAADKNNSNGAVNALKEQLAVDLLKLEVPKLSWYVFKKDTLEKIKLKSAKKDYKLYLKTNPKAEPVVILQTLSGVSLAKILRIS